MNKLLKLSILLLLLVLSSSKGLAQGWGFVLEAVVTEDGSKMSNAIVTVIKNGKTVETIKSDSRGKVNVNLDPDADYNILFSGEGMISKKLNINTFGVPPEDAGESNFYFPADVDIFKKIPGLDLKILDQPIGKIRYNKSIANFDADLDYTKQMKAALDKLQKDYERKKAEDAANAAENKKIYDAAVKIADKLFAEANWREAKTQYEIAQKALPEELHPSFQLAEIQSKLIKEDQLNGKYKAAMDQANAAYTSKNYEAALSGYKNAQGIKPSEKEPGLKITEIEGILANSAKVEQDYLAAINEGEKALISNNLQPAKAAFERASALKPDEQYPKNKLAEIADFMNKAGAKEKEYTDALAAGEKSITEKNYVQAKNDFQKAQSLKPNEKLPQDKLKQIEGLMAEKAKIEQNYLAAIQKGEDALSAKGYDEAKIAFSSASKLKPSEEYPKNKIKEIEDFLAKNSASEKKYKDAIAQADNDFKASNYEAAKSKYEEAAVVKPAEAYPKTKIEEIKGILAEGAKKEQEYLAAIASADKAFTEKNYSVSKVSFEKATALKPNEKYPQDKLKEIQTLLAASAKVDEEYVAAISNADKAYSSSNLEFAKAEYDKAAKLKPNEKYPQTQIVEVDRLIAEKKKAEEAYAAVLKKGDDALAKEELEAAKISYTEAIGMRSNEQYPKDKLKEVEAKITAKQKELEDIRIAKDKEAELDKKYKEAIALADKSYTEKSYAEAITAFKNASELKSAETYPKEKITEINGILAEIAKKDKEYTAALKSGDDALGNGAYEEAKKSYNNALTIKPNEQYPKDKIAEADKLAANAEAAAAAKAEAAKKDAAYQEKIAIADKEFSAKEYEKAKTSYQAALAIKANEQYPKDKIAEADQLIAATLDAKAAADRAAKLDADYKKMIADADGQFNSKTYEKALETYGKALAIKPKESYPQTKIDEINSLLGDKAAADAAAKKKAELEANYKKIIADADAAFKKEDFDNAKSSYKAAFDLISEEYPKSQIDKINTILAERDAIKLKNDKNAALEADYLAAIKKGDELFNAADYNNSIVSYEKAIQLKDQEAYPKNQIEKINKKLAELASKKNVDKEKLEKYNALVAAADQEFFADNYDEAIKGYNAALVVMDEIYPKQQITKIEKAIADKKAAELAAKDKAEQDRLNKLAADKDREAAYKRLIVLADDAYKSQKYKTAKGDYEAALDIKAGEKYPTEQLKLIIEKLAEEERLRAEEERKRLEAQNQPVVVQQERQTVDGKSEAEIDAMYKEIWAKKASDKAKIKEEEAEKLREKRVKDAEADDLKRQEELARIENIKINMASNQPEKTERYLQNLDEVNEKTNAINSAVEDNKMAAKRKRDEMNMQLEDLIARVQRENDARTTDNLKTNFDNLSNEAIQYRNNLAELEVAQRNRSEKSYDEMMVLVKKIEEYQKSTTEKNLENNKVKPLDKAEFMDNFKTANEKEAEQIKANNEAQVKDLEKRQDELREKYDDQMEVKTAEYANMVVERDQSEFQAQKRNAERKEDVLNKDFYKGEKKLRNDDELAAKYPPGVTEEIIDGKDNSTTIRRIVKTATQVDIYEKTLYTWGAVYYTKNGTNIDEAAWQRETK